MSIVIWLFCLAAALAALYQAYRFYQYMMASDEGTPKMVEIAGYVREGADAYLRQQYVVIAIAFAVIFILLLLSAFWIKILSVFVPFAFLVSGFLSGLAGWLGMKTATWASSRTAANAEKSLDAGLTVAFRSGAVMGLVVVGLALLDITIWYAVLNWIVGLTPTELSVTMLAFGMGASGQALFARVGGGIFTKAADVGADLVGKVERGIPEDDARNPATIADNVGDNVGDVAGMGADLYESFYGSLLASAALGVAAFSNPAILESVGIQDPSTETILDYQTRALLLPLSIAAAGIFVSIGSMYTVRSSGEMSQRTLLRAINRGISLAAGLVSVVVVLLALLLLTSFWTLAFSVISGLVAGWAIGKWTEYSTSDEFPPTRKLADQAVTGPATVIIGGVAEGMMSTWVPVLVIVTATFTAYGCAAGWENLNDSTYFSLGLYGVGVAAVGMLSTLGITLATDAYGPIADNAGGNAQMAELEPIVRERTDALDSLGNTTAATGKGFAIGSAALTVLALLAAYMESVREGFQSWAESVVVAEAEPGFYKLNPQTVVEVLPGKDGEAPTRNVWLLLPQDALAPAWREIPASRTGDKISASFQINEDSEYAPASAKLFSEELKLSLPTVALRRATTQDFMKYYDVTLMNPRVLMGVFIGGMITFVFCALTLKAVGRAAGKMVEEVRRQFREKPGIMEGTDKPDYAMPVKISTKAAQQEMILPTFLGLAVPILIALLFGVAGVTGLLAGALASGFCIAVFMANAGGAWDNAKKYIESGKHGGKGTEAHKAAVVGDTVGDPFKDTSGPSLNILIKLMSMVSIVFAGLAVRYSLQAFGWF